MADLVIFDILTLICQIFTLSAVPFNKMPAAITECFSVLKPGGLLLFRDYGNSLKLELWDKLCIHLRI